MIDIDQNLPSSTRPGQAVESPAGKLPVSMADAHDQAGDLHGHAGKDEVRIKNYEMGRTPHPGPLPIAGSDAERGKVANYEAIKELIATVHLARELRDVDLFLMDHDFLVSAGGEPWLKAEHAEILKQAVQVRYAELNAEIVGQQKGRW